MLHGLTNNHRGEHNRGDGNLFLLKLAIDSTPGMSLKSIFSKKQNK